ncbi:MAG: hypothetical protein E7610_09465 [Ruminococcaceae bacterium]|nr:hypothetical protein [Oscillospiraceae bacterium]
MPRKNPFKKLGSITERAYRSALARVKKFTKQTDEVLSEEPIDFSSPSIPYYENLANRLSFARVVLYMVLVVFLVVTIACNHRLITYENLYYLAKDIGAATLTAQSQADRISYPISSSKADFALYRGGMVAAGCEVVTAASGSGRQTLSVNVAYADPCVRTSEKYCITFGRGEKSFAVYNPFVRVYREITEFPVYDAVVGDNGYFAVVTRSRDYTSEVILYNDNMEKIANYHLNGYVTGLAMDREGSRLGVVSAESVNGLWETKITLIRMGQRISAETATLSGSFGSICGFVDEDRLAVMLSDRLLVFAPDATVKGEVLFGEDTPALCTVSRGRIAVLFRSRADLSENLLRVYDEGCRRVYEVTLDKSHPVQTDGGALEIAFGGDRLYVRTVKSLYRVSGNGEEWTSVPVSHDTLKILPAEDEVYVCTPAYAARVDRRDFN